MPKGVFHYVETENVFDGGFKVPDAGEKLVRWSRTEIPDRACQDPMRMIAEMMQTASNAGTKRSTMSGIYVPMPFGMRPLNLQVAHSPSTNR